MPFSLLLLLLMVLLLTDAFLVLQPAVSARVWALAADKRGLTAGATIAENNKAKNSYELYYTLGAGTVLTGTEVKAWRQGNVIMSDGHAFLFNVHIGTCDRTASCEDYFAKRERKLLLHGKEILKAEQRVLQQNYDIVPLRMVFSDKNYVKVHLGAGKQKSVMDKRDDIKKKEGQKDIRRAMKGDY